MIKKKLPKQLWVYVQLFLAILFLGITISQVNLSHFWLRFKETQLEGLAFALGFLLLSQVLSAYRLTQVFRFWEIPIGFGANFRLYLLGMFYNFFLPSGLGGDALKAIYLKRDFGQSTQLWIKMLFLDRAIGLGALIGILAFFDWGLPTFYGNSWVLFLAISGVGYIITRGVFKAGGIFFKAYGLSLGIQLLQLGAAAALIETLHLGSSLWALLKVFLISSIAAIFSFAGVGLREYIFLQSGNILALEAEASTLVGFWFTILTALLSLGGLYFILFPKRLQLKG